MKITRYMPSPNRRGVLFGAAASAGLIGMPFIGRGLAAGPIKIGVMVAPPEKFGIGLKYVRYGVDVAVAAAKGMAAGQPIEIVQLDEGGEAVTLANVKTLIGEHKVAAIIGGTFAGDARAMIPVIAQANTPLIIHSAMDDNLTGANCSRWSFRVPIPFSVQYRAISSYLTGYGKKWFTVMREGATGDAMRTVALNEAKAAGATEVGVGRIAAGATDFAPIIAKILEAKPDVVVGCLLAGDLTAFLKARVAAGMTNSVPFAQPAIGDADVLNAGFEAANGVFTKTWHFSDPQISAEDKAFIAQFDAAYQEMPGTRGWQAYMAMRSLIAAIDAAGSPEPKKIVTALESYHEPIGDITRHYRASDHQMLNRVVILETKTAPASRFDWWDAETHYPVKASELEPLFGTAGCKFVG